MTALLPTDQTVVELFANAGESAALSWFAGDLSPEAGWHDGQPDSRGMCVLRGEGLRSHVMSLASGLVDAGVMAGERVAIMMANRPEHWLTDLAVLHAGAVPITFYGTLSPEQVRAQAEHARVGTVVLESSQQFQQWSAALELPGLNRLIILDESATPASPGVAQLSYLEVLDRGSRRLAEEPDAVTRRARDVGPDDYVTVVFTSGTTSAPKAVPITHRNVVSVAAGFEAAGILPTPYRTVSYLPMAHILDRLISMYLVVILRGETSFSPTPDSFGRVLAQAQPTSLIGVPRIWEKLLSAMERSVAEDPSLDALSAVGLRDLSFAGTGGAPTSASLAARLRELGVPLVDAWGLTESAGTVTVSTVADARPGTVGRPLPGAEVGVAPDGELLIRGPQVAPGYLQPDDTLVPIVGWDGWFATGDVGSIDDDGYVRILDRKKEVIITSGGKNVSPIAVESMLVASPLVAQALAFGSEHPFIVALLTLDVDFARVWLRTEHGIDATELTDEEIAAQPDVREELARAVMQANSGLARAEQIKRWDLLARPWSIDDGTLTPTLKLRRAEIHERYRDQLEGLYLEAESRPEGRG